ncbi:MAG: hypothetical protein KA715_11455 [Xanthomonadaceae bacterium]|nr:hypothetical protein [Xanthomonadaceae bacterium]
MFRVILSAIGLAVLFFTGVFAYFGAFNTITVTESDIGPFTLVYQSNVGDYKQTGSTVDYMMKISLSMGATPIAGFGQYYDDPSTVALEKLRSDAGIVIDPKDLGKFQNYAHNLKSEHKILTREFPLTRAVTSEFPLRGILSTFLGIIKAYPVMDQYMKSKNYPMTYAFEIYPLNEKKVQYAFPLK